MVAQPTDLHRVFEGILPVGRAELQAADKLEKLGVEIGDSDLERRCLTIAEKPLLHLALDLDHQLLDSTRVDAAVLNEIRQSLTGNFAPHRFKARQDHRTGSIVDDQVDTGSLLERANIAPLATDDPALHFVGRQIDYRYRALDHVL